MEIYMSKAQSDIVGIGSAIVDIIGRCDDAFLSQHGCAKGSMQLVDPAQFDKLYNGMGPGIEASGGSVANTVAGVSSFGGKGVFIGTVADDDFGRIFTHDIRALGVAFNSTPVKGRAPTSRSLILVTPDGERTMNTFLGISTQFEAAQLDEAIIAAGHILYLEGYLFDTPEAKAAFRQGAALAKKAGRKVALSLSDAFCVDRHRDEFMAFIKSDVDILFANESEVTSLYKTTSFDEAARHAQADTKLAALTRGAKGSVILRGAETVTIAVEPVAKVVDTTGAGDLYAAGFLFGVARDLELATAGRLGSLAAAEIISHLGARPEANLAGLAKAKGLI
jgi:sugar/nucleoside kinase (ribokinase family)